MKDPVAEGKRWLRQAEVDLGMAQGFLSRVRDLVGGA